MSYKLIYRTKEYIFPTVKSALLLLFELKNSLQKGPISQFLHSSLSKQGQLQGLKRDNEFYYIQS